MTYGLMKETLAAFSEKRKSLIPKRHMHCACSLWIYTEEMLCTLLCQHMKRCWLRREVCSHSKYSPLSSAWQQFTVGRCFSAHQAGKHDSMRARSLHGWAVERGLGGGDGAAATVQLLLGNLWVQNSWWQTGSSSRPCCLQHDGIYTTRYRSL